MFVVARLEETPLWRDHYERFTAAVRSMFRKTRLSAAERRRSQLLRKGGGHVETVCHIYRYLGFSVIKWESLCNQDGMDTTNTSILVWIPLWTDMVLWLTTLDDLRIWGVVVEGV